MIDDFCFFVFLFVCPIVSILGFISFTCHSYLYILHDTACLARVLPTMALALVFIFPFFPSFSPIFACALTICLDLVPEDSLAGCLCLWHIRMYIHNKYASPVKSSQIKHIVYSTAPIELFYKHRTQTYHPTSNQQ